MRERSAHLHFTLFVAAAAAFFIGVCGGGSSTFPGGWAGSSSTPRLLATCAKVPWLRGGGFRDEEIIERMAGELKLDEVGVAGEEGSERESASWVDESEEEVEEGEEGQGGEVAGKLPVSGDPSYLYSMEEAGRRPNVIRPITCDADIPRLGPEGHTFVSDMTEEAMRGQQLGMLTKDYSSDTEDPMDELYPQMASFPKVTRNMTEDEFYFGRDYRPGKYRPVPGGWTVFDADNSQYPQDPGRQGWPKTCDPDYSISAMKQEQPPPKGWRERDAKRLIPWVRRFAAMSNRTACKAPAGLLSNATQATGSEGLGWDRGRAVTVQDTRVPEDEKSIRRAIKATRGSLGGAIVLHEGDHWPTRALKLRSKEETEMHLVGGMGQARVWGQVIGSGAGGQIESLAALYLTRASAKPTILVEGGEWVVDCCEARSRGGVSIIVSGGNVMIQRSGMGGFGEAVERTARGRATNVLSAFEQSRVQIRDGCTVEWADLGGLRFYGACNATVEDVHVREIGWYGLLVDHNATVGCWNGTFSEIGKGAIGTSVSAKACRLQYGNCTFGDGVKEWWGPQRPKTLRTIINRSSLLEDSWGEDGDDSG